jgi:hypothetical protein
MLLKSETQRTLQVSNVDDYLLIRLEAFLIDRKVAGVSAPKWLGLSILMGQPLSSQQLG